MLGSSRIHPHHLTQSVNLGTAPSASDLAFALTIAVIAFTGLEAAASVAGEVSATRKQIKTLVGSSSALIVLVYVGIAIVGVGVLPVAHGITPLGTTHIKAPMLGVAEALHPTWVADVLKYVVGIAGAVGLTAAAGASMLGVSRLGYLLATNRQIRARSRTHPRWGTRGIGTLPWQRLLVVPRDLSCSSTTRSGRCWRSRSRTSGDRPALPWPTARVLGAGR